MEKVYQMFIEPSHSYTVRHTGDAFGGGKYYH